MHIFGLVFNSFHIYVVITRKNYGSENIRLCRDDGLSIFRKASGPEAEKYQKACTENILRKNVRYHYQM